MDFANECLSFDSLANQQCDILFFSSVTKREWESGLNESSISWDRIQQFPASQLCATFLYSQWPCWRRHRWTAEPQRKALLAFGMNQSLSQQSVWADLAAGRTGWWCGANGSSWPCGMEQQQKLHWLPTFHLISNTSGFLRNTKRESCV